MPAIVLTQEHPDVAERFIEASKMVFEKLVQMPRKRRRQEVKGGIEILRVLSGVQNIDAIMDDEDFED